MLRARFHRVYEWHVGRWHATYADLKVVPFQYSFLDGEQQHTYLYKANYNEYKPRKLEWYEGKADAYVDTDLVPNAAFHYDISPVMVMMEERTQSFSSFVTKICAVRAPPAKRTPA